MRSQLMVCAAGFVGVLAAAAMAAAPEIDVVGYRVKVQNERIVLIGEERDRGIAFVYPPNARKPIRLEGVSTQKRGIADVQVLANGYLFTNEGSDVSNVLGVLRTPDGKEVWRRAYGMTEYDHYLTLSQCGRYAVTTGGYEFLILDGLSGRVLVAHRDTTETQSFGAAFSPTGDVIIVSNGHAMLVHTARLRRLNSECPVPLDSVCANRVPLREADGTLLGPSDRYVVDWFFASPTGGRFCAKLMPLRGASRYDPCRFAVIDTALNVWIVLPDSAVAPQVRNVNVVSDRHILLTANCRALVLDAETRSVAGRLGGLACQIWQAMEREGRITFVRMDDEIWEPQRKAGIFKSWEEADWAVPIIFDTPTRTFRTSDTVYYGVLRTRAVMRSRNSTKLRLWEE